MPTTPYDQLIDVLNKARMRLNDSITTLQPVSGKLLQNNSVFTLVAVNAAWRRFQESLANLGYTPLRQEIVIANISPVASLDPASQVNMDWNGYYDGAVQHLTPTLPNDLMVPLKCWERQSGTQSMFSLMENIVDGLPDWPKQAGNRVWEWRAEKLYMPGALLTTDVRLRYSRYLPDFADTNTVQWFNASVPMLRCADPFSYFICAEIGDAREDLDGDVFRMKGEAAASLMMNRDVAMKQRGNIRRQSRSGRLEGNGGSDWFC